MSMCQASSRPARRAELDPTLDGIVEKLRMLRAEIDATLVDLIIYNSQHGTTPAATHTRAAMAVYPARRIAFMNAAAAHARILRKRCAARLDAARIATHALMQRTSRLLRRKTARASRIAPSQLPPHTHMSMRQAGPAIATMLALSFTAAMVLGERMTTPSETLEPGSAQASATSWAELSGRHVQAWPHRL
jgi:hypothetical protein